MSVYPILPGLTGWRTTLLWLTDLPEALHGQFPVSSFQIPLQETLFAVVRAALKLVYLGHGAGSRGYHFFYNIIFSTAPCHSERSAHNAAGSTLGAVGAQ
jgi:hypothetical protein